MGLIRTSVTCERLVIKMRIRSSQFQKRLSAATFFDRNTALPLMLSGSIIELMNLGMPEMIFIFLLALIIFGPKKLPEIGRQLGKALNEFKRASNEFRSQIESEINRLDVNPQTIMSRSEPVRGTLANLPVPESLAAPASLAGELPETAAEQKVLAKAPDA